MVVLEDLHCIDDSSVEITNWLLGCEDLRFVVLAFGHDSSVERFPSLFSNPSVLRIDLGPLSIEASEQLISSVLPDLTRERAHNIADRSGGNALFLEELVRHATEGRDEIPLSVQALMQSRLDVLSPELRVVLRAASVFGPQCWTQGVSALLERDCEQDLRALADAEFLVRLDNSSIAEQEEWNFPNTMLRETAYTSLVPEDRSALHRIASEWLLVAGQEDTGAIARHAEAGGDTARAAVLYARAAVQAYANGQLVAGLDFADKAVGLTETPAIRGPALLQRAQILAWLSRYQEQYESAEAVSNLAVR